MSKFNVKDFVRKPSVELLQASNPCKDDLKYKAIHFNIEFASDISKSDLHNLVINTLVNAEVLPEEARSLLQEGSDTSERILATQPLQFQLQMQQLKLQELEIQFADT